MAELNSYFTDFLANIRLSQTARDELKKGHTLLRERLQSDLELSGIILNTFLQGSYRRSTIVRPKSDENADVDIIVITDLNPDDYDPPIEALNLFEPFLERHYPDKWRIQGRSIGIKLSKVDLDLVITARPPDEIESALLSAALTSDEDLEALWENPRASQQLSSLYEAKQKSETLLIPDCDAGAWEPTDPVAQLLWTWDMSRSTSGHFVNVVKALKWWRRVHAPSAKHPKSYPLEHLIGDCCPDTITSVADGVTKTLEEAVTSFATDVALGQAPDLRDRGVDQNVFKRVSPEDFKAFYREAEAASQLARKALDETDTAQSAVLWRELLGEEFPAPPESDNGSSDGGSGALTGGFTERTGPSSVGTGRFA